MIDLRLLTTTFFSSLKTRSRLPIPLSRTPSPPTSDSGLSTSLSSTSEDYSLPSTPSAESPYLLVRESPPSTPSRKTNDELIAPSHLSLPTVLLSLDLDPFIGRLHSGQCDARNASRILVELARRGQNLVSNRIIPEGGRGGRERRWPWMGASGVVEWEAYIKRENICYAE